MTASITHTTVLDPNEPRLEDDPTRLLRRGLATALALLAPLLFTLSNVAMPSLSGSNANVVQHIPPVAGRLLASHLVYAVASLMMIAVAVVAWRINARRGAVLRLLGGLLLVIGVVSNAFGEVVDGYLAWAMHRANVAPPAQVRVFDLLDKSNAALPISFLAVPVFSLGLLLLMIGIGRSRAVPWWLVGLSIVGGLASAFVGVGVPSLLGLVWAAATAAVVVLVDRRTADQTA